MSKVLIVVEGGVIQDISVDHLEVEICVVDLDNIKDGDPPPTSFDYPTYLISADKMIKDLRELRKKYESNNTKQ